MSEFKEITTDLHKYIFNYLGVKDICLTNINKSFNRVQTEQLIKTTIKFIEHDKFNLEQFLSSASNTKFEDIIINKLSKDKLIKLIYLLDGEVENFCEAFNEGEEYKIPKPLFMYNEGLISKKIIIETVKELKKSTFCKIWKGLFELNDYTKFKEKY